MTQIIHDRPTDIDTSTPADGEQLARQQAIKQIERRRRFKVSTAVAAVGMALLVVIWAMSEYHNAGGWPTRWVADLRPKRTGCRPRSALAMSGGELHR